jgi:hypothetical protein
MGSGAGSIKLTGRAIETEPLGTVAVFSWKGCEPTLSNRGYAASTAWGLKAASPRVATTELNTCWSVATWISSWRFSHSN